MTLRQLLHLLSMLFFKYEISDFLYHVMVLMAVKGITWEDITKELANR